MVENLAGQSPQIESIRHRPSRIANKLLRCKHWKEVAGFYEEELGDISPKTLFQRDYRELSADEKDKLKHAVRDKFAQLIKDSIISPEAFTQSCTRISPISHWISLEEEFQRMQEPFFELTLSRYLPKNTLETDSPPAVLSLACGVDAEARAIHRHFSSESEKSGVHIGIDRNNSNIESARRLYRENPGYVFIEGDLDSKDVRNQVEEIRSEFDIVMMRHFPVLPEEDLWERTLKDYARFLRPGGFLVMTLYYPEEFETVSRVGIPSDYNVEVAERNKARSFNKRLFNQVIMQSVFGALADELRQERYADVVENVFRQDQFVVLATKK